MILLWNDVITVLFLKWWFSISIFPSTSIIEVLWQGRIFPSHLYIYLTYFYLYIFILWIIIHYYHCSRCPQFGHWELLKVVSSVLWHTSITFWTFSYFLACKIFQAYSVLPLLQSLSLLFIQGALIPFFFFFF